VSHQLFALAQSTFPVPELHAHALSFLFTPLVLPQSDKEPTAGTGAPPPMLAGVGLGTGSGAAVVHLVSLVKVVLQ
jgi:hypothetical protein